jgi:hypothetical protein
MGGLGSGGFRMNAGQKPKDAAQRRLHGSRGAKASGATQSPAADYVAPPDDLAPSERAVWDRLAPHAIEARTLVASTAFAFAHLCRAVVLERALWAQIEADGLTSVRVTTDVTSGEQHSEAKAHALLPRHNAMQVRVEQNLTRFRLAPIGREIAPAAPVEDDPFAKFDVQ